MMQRCLNDDFMTRSFIVQGVVLRVSLPVIVAHTANHLIFRKAGVWCTCKECSKNFDIPVVSNFCRDCHGSSQFEDVTIKDVYAYSLKEQVREEAALGWVLITPIREFLVEEKFDVESPAFLKGKSGANHVFDIV